MEYFADPLPCPTSQHRGILHQTILQETRRAGMSASSGFFGELFDAALFSALVH